MINAQLVNESDIVFGVFYSRLGTPTRRAASGTAEEIARSIQAGKQVHLYFAKKMLPYDIDLTQLQSLREFKASMESQGLVADFGSDAELYEQVGRSIEWDITLFRSSSRSKVIEPESIPYYGETGRKWGIPVTDDDDISWLYR